MNVIQTVEHEGAKLEIWQDDTTSPREDDNLTKMICLHRKYDLGDSHDYTVDMHDSWLELKKDIVKTFKPLVILPLFMLDHSGITISTEDFNDEWDSGQVGWVFISNKEVDLTGCTINTGESFRDYETRLIEQLKGEVAIYDQYLRGDVYGFTHTDSEGEDDSCGGFYGTDWENNGLADHVDNEVLTKKLE